MTYWQGQPQPVYVVRPALPPMSGMAVGGFVVSLLWGFGFLSPIGLGLSIAGYRQTQRGSRGAGLAIAGMILGGLGTAFLVSFLATWV